MNWWFFAMVLIYVLNLGVALATHGKPKEGNVSFWSTLIGSLIGITLIYFAVMSGF